MNNSDSNEVIIRLIQPLVVATDTSLFCYEQGTFHAQDRVVRHVLQALVYQRREHQRRISRYVKRIFYEDITHPSSPLAWSPDMSDKDIVDRCRAADQACLEAYAAVMNEAALPELRNIIRGHQTQIQTSLRLLASLERQSRV